MIWTYRIMFSILSDDHIIYHLNWGLLVWANAMPNLNLVNRCKLEMSWAIGTCSHLIHFLPTELPRVLAYKNLYQNSMSLLNLYFYNLFSCCLCYVYFESFIILSSLEVLCCCVFLPEMAFLLAPHSVFLGPVEMLVLILQYFLIALAKSSLLFLSSQR